MPKRKTPDEVYKQWCESFQIAEQNGGIKSFCLVAITNEDESLHYVSEGESYRNMLGALEHLKLKFFMGHND